MDAIGDSLQIYKGCVTLPRVDNEKLHITESQSPRTYTEWVQISVWPFRVTPCVLEGLRKKQEWNYNIVYIRRSEIRISRADNQTLLTSVLILYNYNDTTILNNSQTTILILSNTIYY